MREIGTLLLAGPARKHPAQPRAAGAAHDNIVETVAVDILDDIQPLARVAIAAVDFMGPQHVARLVCIAVEAANEIVF